MYQTEYVVMYANYLIIWCSKLYTDIGLSTVEIEYISISQALHNVIPLILVATRIAVRSIFFRQSTYHAFRGIRRKEIKDA